MKAKTAIAMLERIASAKVKRAWDKLPMQYESQAARALGKMLALDLEYLDKVGTIAERIALARCNTFDELKDVIVRRQLKRIQNTENCQHLWRQVGNDWRYCDHCEWLDVKC